MSEATHYWSLFDTTGNLIDCWTDEEPFLAAIAWMPHEARAVAVTQNHQGSILRAWVALGSGHKY